MAVQYLQTQQLFPLWDSDPEKCHALFKLHYDADNILIEFNIVETFLNAKKRPFNDEVHMDNCVEFFIQFDNDPNYYNFEFNCLGSIKAAYGTDRHNRSFVTEEQLKKIEQGLKLTICSDEQNRISWRLSAQLNADTFCFSNLQSLHGIGCRVNATKCGDSLPQPHFLSWVKIETPEPDFHRPEYFRHLTLP